MINLRVVYLSDVHTEINGLGRLNCKFADGDVLVLAGDILNAAMLDSRRSDPKARGTQKALEFLKKRIFPKYKKIFKVMGNHTHYDGCYPLTEQQVRMALKDVPNLHLLENQSVYFEGVLFLGCTFWTDYSHNNPLAMMAARVGMNDYRWILEKPYESLSPEDKLKWNTHKPLLTPEFIYKVHLESVDYLKKTLELHKDLPTVLITHHPLSFNSIHASQMNSLSPAFASAREDIILDNPQIKYAIHGHTHFSGTYKIGDTYVVSNQCGYYTEHCYPMFKPNACFDI